MADNNRPDPGEWSVADVFRNLKIQHAWASLAALVLLVIGAFSLGLRIAELRTSTTSSNRDGTVRVLADFIVSRKLAYDAAVEMVEQVAVDPKTTESIINLRAGGNAPEQNELYDVIIKEVRKGEILYTRAATIESDPDLDITERFLRELADKDNARIILVFDSPTVPSCFITDAVVLLGFKADDGTINHGLKIKGPEKLVQDLRTMYQKILSGPSSILIKDFGRTLTESEADDRTG